MRPYDPLKNRFNFISHTFETWWGNTPRVAPPRRRETGDAHISQHLLRDLGLLDGNDPRGRRR